MAKLRPGARATEELVSQIAGYYTDRLNRFGPTPKGVDWNSTASQRARFAQLCKVVAGRTSFSLNDVGCGYGALCDYLGELGLDVDYRGYDISEAMIDAAKARCGGVRNRQFHLGTVPAQAADYTVASGILNVRLDTDSDSWLAYAHETLEILNRSSRLGFAFNCLTSYSDVERLRTDLFYGDPRHFFDLCMTRFSRQVALLHDYGLFEFTMIVRKDG